MAAARVSVETQNLASLLPVALYAALAALYPLAAGLEHPRQGWMAQAHADPMIFLAHTAIYAGLLAFFALTLRNAGRLAPRMIWLAFALSALALLFAFPGESLDIFDYLFRGRMLAEYGRSPLRLAPITLEHAPFYRYITWAAWVDAYGPLWEYASAAVAWGVAHSAPAAHGVIVSDQSCTEQPLICAALIRYVTGYRLLAIAATAWCGVWIARIAPAAQRPRALALFLLNPLTLISSALGAHNDVLMLALVLPACALLVSFRGAAEKSRFSHRSTRFLAALEMTSSMSAALILLGLAAHVKLTALIFVPVALIWLWRRIGILHASAAALLAGALLAPLSWALYRPLGGWATLANNLYERSQLSANSIGELLYVYRRYGLGIERYQAQIPASQALTLAFALLAGALLLIWLLRRGPADLKALSGLAGGVTLLYLLIGSYWFQPWYALWGLALSALWPASLLARRVMPALAAVALCAAAGADFLRHTPPMPLAGWQISALFVAALWIAVTSTAALAWRSYCRDQRTA